MTLRVAIPPAARGRAFPEFRCPSCSGLLSDRAEGLGCVRCLRAFPVVAGIPDLRLSPDRYLSLGADREKAAWLAEVAGTTDFEGLIDAYYAGTADVDARRRALYRAHVRRAEARGAAIAATLPRGGIVLDVGCGSGGLLAALARTGRRVVGVDVAIRWLVASRRRLDDLGRSAPIIGASADRLPWPDASFDAVVSDSVLEHLDDPGGAIREWARVLKPGGHLRIWSPNRWSVLADPHVGLPFVGWLPRALAPAYVRAFRGCEWPIRPLGAAEAARLLDPTCWESIESGAAPLGPSMAEEPRLKDALRVHETLRRWRLPARVLRAIGPVWQVRATRAGDR